MTKQTTNIYQTVLKRSLLRKSSETNTGKGTKICVINDSEILREGLFSILHKLDNISQLITTSKNDYLTNYATTNFDIIITDIEFQNTLDVSFIKRIKLLSPKTKIVVYTSLENYVQRNFAFIYGASYFMLFGNTNPLMEIIMKVLIRKKND